MSLFAQSNTYDYIVVGSGPGGPLAADLAKAGNSVLLLEAEDDRRDQLENDYIIPKGLPAMASMAF